jgi:hypothetical protein
VDNDEAAAAAVAARHIQLQQSNSAELLAYYLKTNDGQQQISNKIPSWVRREDPT